MEVTSAPLCKELIRFDLFISFSHMRSSHSPSAMQLTPTVFTKTTTIFPAWMGAGPREIMCSLSACGNR